MTVEPLDRRALSRALSHIAGASVAEILALDSNTATATRRIGVTGPPGVGKSSLISQLAGQRLGNADRLAIIAVDPTSPLSGGAILGDRIRMEELATDSRVYIRSLASRTSQDGLADNLALILNHLERAGFPELIVESVGVGQVEYDIAHLTDTLVLVLMPGTGDQIQAMKSGILERADIIAVNKADTPGAPQLLAALTSVIETRGKRDGWSPPVILTSTTQRQGIEDLSRTIDRHQTWMARSDRHHANLRERRRYLVASLVARRLHEVMRDLPDSELSQPLAALYDSIMRAVARAPGT